MYSQIINQEKNMITYKDLCNGLIKLKNESENNKQDLINALNDMVIFTSTDLGLLDKTWKDASGNLNHYISILDITDKSKPKATNIYQLQYNFEHRTVSCEFGLQITLEKSESTYPKTNIYIVLSAKKTNGKVSITINNFDGAQTFEIHTPYHLHLSDLNDAIKQSIMSIFE